MGKPRVKPNYRRRVLRLPDLDHCKTAVLHSLGSPASRRAGNLFGTTKNGGANGKGTVFKLAPQPDGTWKRSKVHVFKGTDGTHPYAGLIFDAAGNLYGATYGGGAYNAGTAFKLVPNPDGSWKWSKLHTFKGTDGARPYGGLMIDAAGHLYGTTVKGGLGSGVLFKIKP